MPHQPIKLGICGFGGSTNIYNLPYILPNKNLTLHAFLQRAAADSPTPGRFGHCTTKYPSVKHYRDASTFFADAEIELVLVLTGHTSHFALAKAALEAGKHVLVEKPFVTSSKEADELIALARKKGKVLTVYQNRRWDGEFLTVKKLLGRNGTAGGGGGVEGGKNALGELTDVEIHYDMEMPAWISGWTVKEFRGLGEGMMYGLGSHSIDQALQLLGTPSVVTGWGRALRGIESEVDGEFLFLFFGWPRSGSAKKGLV
jgi:predicted dehydrogenase